MNDLVKQSYQMTVTDPSAIAAAESVKARIQAAYIMAINRPRNADDARIRILEACRRPEFAARVEFSKPVAGKQMRGPSIRFAETALRLWGNIDSDIQVVYDDENFRRINVRVTDLETNSTFSKQINIRKTVERKNATGRDGVILGERLNSKGEKVFIVQSTDDELMTKENALISKALRNEGLRLIPSDIIDEGLAMARETLRKKDSQDPAAAKKRLFDSFAGIGIKPRDLEKYLKHSVDTISPAELETMRAVYQAIKDGEATWSDFLATEDDDKKEPPAAPKFQDEAPAGEKTTRTRRTKAEMEAERRAKEQPGAGDAATDGPNQKPPAGEVVEQFPAPPGGALAPNGNNPTIGQGLEDTEEWGILMDLIKSKRMGYLQLKIDLKMPQGPKDLVGVQTMIASLESWTPKPPMREPGEDDK